MRCLRFVAVLATLVLSGCGPVCGGFGPQVVEGVRTGVHTLDSIRVLETGLTLAGASDLVVRIDAAKSEVVLEYVKDGQSVVERWSVVASREEAR